VIDDEEGDDEDFFEGRLSSEESGEVFEKWGQKLIDFIIRLVFLEWVGEEVAEEFSHKISEDLKGFQKISIHFLLLKIASFSSGMWNPLIFCIFYCIC